MASSWICLNRVLPACVLGALLSACASQVPLNIREAPTGNPALQEVRENTARFESQSVRWGGEILGIDNRKDVTVLTMLSRPLSKGGEPLSTDNSPGRFVAHIPAFIDPKVYTAGRNVTVRGRLAGTETLPVGEHLYAYPVVKATEWYLWPEPVEYSNDYPYPGWYGDPWFYDPWYRHPFYHRYPRHKDKDK